MSLDDRLRAARPDVGGPSTDLDGMLQGSMRAGRRRRRTQRATAVVGVSLVLLTGNTVGRNLLNREPDVADRIQKQEKDKREIPVPTAKFAPGSDAGSSSVGGKRQGGPGSDTKKPSAAVTTNGTVDRIAFVTAEPLTDIYAMNLDGSEKKLLGPGAEPDWSPDGDRIAYSRGHTNAGCSSTTAKVDPPDPCEVWVMDADGSNQHRLTAGWSPDWSPDGKRIAYAAGQNSSELYVMNADGSGSVRITETPNTSPSTQGANSPSWSPDGKRIAFSRRAKCGEACWTNYLYVVKPDGSGLEAVTSLKEAIHPAWSPDGERIAFEAQADNNAEIFTVSLDVYDVRRLTDDDRGDRAMDNYDGFPAWSPDGRLAFVSDPDGPSGSAVCAMSGVDADCGAGGPAPPHMSLVRADGSGRVDIGEGRMPDFAPGSR